MPAHPRLPLTLEGKGEKKKREKRLLAARFSPSPIFTCVSFLHEHERSLRARCTSRQQQFPPCIREIGLINDLRSSRAHVLLLSTCFLFVFFGVLCLCFLVLPLPPGFLRRWRGELEGFSRLVGARTPGATDRTQRNERYFNVSTTKRERAPPSLSARSIPLYAPPPRPPFLLPHLHF